ncbi:glycosyltransferase family 4 protein [Candidatus Amesbacteria bacterium]|nr:glycosyltransferase family 4 protein [Candidatus Amesbacteria bacterium]
MLIGIDANEANLTHNRVGVNQYAFGLLHALYHLKTDHQFIIYLKTPPLDDLPKHRKNWQYRTIPFPKLWTQTRLPFDLYTHSPRPNVFFSMTHYAPRWSPVPTVVAIMDMGFLQTPEQFTAKDFNQLKSWTEYSVRQAAKIITISEYSKKDIIKYFGRKNITVTYPGYDQKLFRPTRNSQVLKKYRITEPYFLFLSSLKPSKNIEGLIRAYSLLPSALAEGDKISLVISGKKGWLFDEIFKTVKDLKLEDRVTFTGFVDEPDVPVLMTHASAFVMPSFFEGFGIPVLEAMACGTPVVISKVASLPEVAGEAGIYVNPHDIASISTGLHTVIGPKRQEFVKMGLERVKLFSWDKCARQTLACLETATANR